MSDDETRCVICGVVDQDPQEHMASAEHREMVRVAYDLNAATYVNPDTAGLPGGG